MQTWGNLEEPPKLQRIPSTLYKFDNPNTLSTVPHDTYLTLQRTPSLVDMVNRQSDVTGFILDVRQSRRKYILHLQCTNKYIQQLVMRKERVKLCQPFWGTQIFES